MIAWQGVSTTGAPHIVGCKNTSVGEERGGVVRVERSQSL